MLELLAHLLAVADIADLYPIVAPMALYRHLVRVMSLSLVMMDVLTIRKAVYVVILGGMGIVVPLEITMVMVIYIAIAMDGINLLENWS
jgi:hypothetical protein